jgi:fibronectin type 3 domain-containing protein
LADSVGQLPLYQLSTAGVTRFYNSADATIYSTNLSPNPFTTPVMIAEGNRRLLMTPVLGQVYGTNITVYIDPDRSQTNSSQRTWLDGIGYELIANTIFGPLVLTNGDLGMSYYGTAGHQYAWEFADTLNSPVVWTPLQTGTADSAGLMSFTNTPSGSQKFYRVRDVTPPPTQVINLTATAGIAQVSLNWTASAFATSYNVKSATTSGGPYTTIGTITGTSFVNTGLVNGTTYYFIVSALNYLGESTDSSEASATPFPPQPPAAPAGVAATAGDGFVSLSWTASVAATGYYVKSATISGGPYATNANVTTTSFVSTNLTNGTTYYFVVSALNAYGQSLNSSETNATPAPVPPAIPSGLTATAGNGFVSLNWTASFGATSYNVKSATTSSGPYTTITNITETSLVNTGLVNGTTYYFVISALNINGESADSPERSATPLSAPPLVYADENTATNYPPPPLPPLVNCPLIQPLPDPFAWANDPFNIGGTRSTAFSDWEHHRAEFFAQYQNYEIGNKPAVDPTNIFASYSAGTLTVRVTNYVSGVAKILTLTCAVSLPSGSGPFPAIIGMNSPNGSVNSSILTSVAKITFSHNQVTTYGSPQNTDPFFQLYPGQNIDNTGQYAAWAWGVSRIIDGLYKVTNSLPIDLKHIGVTGCSYAGKMALFAGALDERIALTIAQESGGGGANSWRYNATEPSGSVEWIPNTDYNWFANQLSQFGGANVSYLPEDHHMLDAMIAPRALFTTDNPDYGWLGNPSCYVACKAAERVYTNFGIADRFGYNIIGGHSHCSTTATIDNEMAAFVNKFLLGQTNVNTLIRDVDPTITNSIDYARWTAWWGTTNAVFPGGASNAITKTFEVECASTIGAAWSTLTDTNASNGKYIVVATNSPYASSLTNAPDITGQIAIPFIWPTNGNVSLFVRGNFINANNDSCWVQIDSGGWKSVNGLPNGTSWNWGILNTYTLTAGAHTLYLGYRETGAKFDKLSISDYPFTPTGMGQTAENLCP